VDLVRWKGKDLISWLRLVIESRKRKMLLRLNCGFTSYRAQKISTKFKLTEFKAEQSTGQACGIQSVLVGNAGDLPEVAIF
jgi:hypothetical protein